MDNRKYIGYLESQIADTMWLSGLCRRMERFVKDPRTLRQTRQGLLCPNIDEFAQHRKGLWSPRRSPRRKNNDRQATSRLQFVPHSGPVGFRR
jgi:hypothetical protein